MTTRRSFLGLLAALPVVGRAIASAEAAPVEKVGRVLADGGSVTVMQPGPLIYDHRSGYARPGDCYLDRVTGTYYVAVPSGDGSGKLVWMTEG